MPRCPPPPELKRPTRTRQEPTRGEDVSVNACPLTDFALLARVSVTVVVVLQLALPGLHHQVDHVRPHDALLFARPDRVLHQLAEELFRLPEEGYVEELKARELDYWTYFEFNPYLETRTPFH